MRSRLSSLGLSLVLLGAAASCAPAPAPRAPRASPSASHRAPAGEPAGSALAATRVLETMIAAPIAPESPVLTPEPSATSSRPAFLAPDIERVELPRGRSLVDIALPAERFVSIGVVGPSHALLGFDLIGPAAIGAIRSKSALDEDGLLPRIVSFWSPSGVDRVTVLVDVTEPVSLIRISAPASPEPIGIPPRPPSTTPGARARPAPAPRPLIASSSAASAAAAAAGTKNPPMPLVGLPAPASRDDGYLLQSPARYQFLRADVAHALLLTFKKVRVRFRRDPIGVADISQWDGLRPATDLGKPRHISHEGGRDVDIALPADDGFPSLVRAHCDGVLVEADAQGCAPGTVRGLDALRLAFLLGYLFDMEPIGRIERVFTDDAYIREIRRAALELRARGWIKDDGFEGLHNDEIMRPSPWHTDHVHIRFTGPGAISRWPSASRPEAPAPGGG